MILLLDTVVVLFGVAMAASPLLQLLRLLKLGRSEDVSLGMLAVLMIGGTLWLCYGIAHSVMALIVCNGIGAGCSATTLVVAWWLRRTRPSQTQQPPRHDENVVELRASSR